MVPTNPSSSGNKLTTNMPGMERKKRRKDGV